MNDKNKAEEEESILLEKRSYEGVEGRSCAGRISTFQFQCWKGSFVSEQRWSDIPDIYPKLPISKEDYGRMHEGKYFNDERGRKHTIQVNQESTIKYTSKGVIFTEDLNTYCSGEDVISDNAIEDGIVQMNIVSLTLKDNITMRFDEEGKRTEDVNMQNGFVMSCK